MSRIVAVAVSASVVLAACGRGSAVVSEYGLTGPPILPPTSHSRQHVALGASNFRDLLYFNGTDGKGPYAGLTDVNGTLYGTTDSGGVAGAGTVFTITRSGREHVLYDFAGGNNDGSYPVASLTEQGSTLYGTTDFGGTNNTGTVFSMTTSGTERVLYSFGPNGSGDGEFPGSGGAGLTVLKGQLYGTTTIGGANQTGTVFSITTSGNEHVLYSFGSAKSGDGTYPNAGLINVKGTLYGTTLDGGNYGAGTVFSITAAGKEQILHSFGGSGDGAAPVAGLLDLKGTLYGTTLNGGSGACANASHTVIGCGAVFEVAASGSERVLHSFSVGYPYAGLADLNGKLYGTTARRHHGTIFSMTTSGTVRTLYRFANGGKDGYFPTAPLTVVSGGLYGTTPLGGLHRDGTVFVLTL